MEYLDPIEAITLQQVNKNFYNKVIPRFLPRVENPTLNLVLERSRKDIQLGIWRANRRQLKTKQLLKIGTGAGEISPEVLQFSEVYFQYFIQTEPTTFYAWPIENEAILTKGFKV